MRPLPALRRPSRPRPGPANHLAQCAIVDRRGQRLASLPLTHRIRADAEHQPHGACVNPARFRFRLISSPIRASPRRIRSNPHRMISGPSGLTQAPPARIRRASPSGDLARPGYHDARPRPRPSAPVTSDRRQRPKDRFALSCPPWPGYRRGSFAGSCSPPVENRRRPRASWHSTENRTADRIEPTHAWHDQAAPSDKLATADLHWIWWLNVRSLNLLDQGLAEVPYLWPEGDGKRLRL